MVLVVPTMTSFKYEDLLGFAAITLQIEKPVKLAKIIFVTRDDMIQTMKGVVNDPESDYPYHKVHGLFQAGTDFVRVVNDLPKVKTESVILHEIIHYIQEQLNGIVPDDPDAPFRQMYREMQAYKIQGLYMETH